MSSVDADYLGIAGSVNALARNIGFILGSVFSVIITFTSISIKSGKHITSYPYGHDQLFMFGFKITFIMASIIILIAESLIVFRFIKDKKIKKNN